MSRHPEFSREGANVLYDAQVPLTTAILGGQITIPTIDGDVEMTVPAGTQPGERKTLRKRGIPHLNRRNERGDQWVTLKVQIPTSISSKQKELLLEAFEKSSATETSSNSENETCDTGKGIFSSFFGGDKKSK